MAPAGRFPSKVLDALRKERIVGLRVGAEHRFIGLWAVVVGDEVFVRSWGISPGGWYRRLAAERRATLNVAGREIPVRGSPCRSAAKNRAVDLAYAAKYPTPGSRRYVADLCATRCRATTTRLAPVGRSRSTVGPDA